jgi:hypothetical protein
MTFADRLRELREKDERDPHVTYKWDIAIFLANHAAEIEELVRAAGLAYSIAYPTMENKRRLKAALAALDKE